MGSPLRIAVFCSVPLLALFIGAAVLNPIGDYWKMVEPPKAQCEAYHAAQLRTQKVLTSEVYDQRKLNRLIREPQNTISNLAYLTAGLAILLAGRRTASMGLGWAAVFLGVGSAVYHASLLPEWRMLDILGVYAVLYGLLLVGLSAILNSMSDGWRGWGMVILVWAFAIYTGVHRNDIRWFGLKIFDSTYVFVVAVALGCGFALFAYRKAVNRAAYFRALVVLIIAATISFSGGIGDRFGGFWAAPESVLQGHAIWHVFGAIALLAAYEIFAAAGYDRSTLK